MDSTFTNIIDNDIWKSDDSFVQRRLAGLCPFNIRKVTQNGKVYYFNNIILFVVYYNRVLIFVFLLTLHAIIIMYGPISLV